MADKDGRIDITKEQFLSTLDPGLSADVRAVIENIIKWSEDNRKGNMGTLCWLENALRFCSIRSRLRF